MANNGYNSRQINSENRTQPTSSTKSDDRPLQQGLIPTAITGSIFLEPLKRLVSSKRTLELTPHQAETWLAALSIYSERPRLVYRAMVELAVDPDPFPDLAKLLARCERIRREADKTLPNDGRPVVFNSHSALAEAWGIQW
jgi:hypothetical protein